MKPAHTESVALGVALMTFTQALCVAAIFTVPVLAPEIARALQMDVSLVGVLAAMVYGVATFASMPGGAAAARHGAFMASILCLVLCAAGAVVCASGTWWGFVLAAVLFGIAAGTETPASAHLLSRLAPAHRRARLFSIRATGNQIGAISASLLMPVAAVAVGWQGGLILVAAACLLGAVLLAFFRNKFVVSDAPLAGAAARPNAIDTLRLVWSSPPLRKISIAAFAFSAMQICLNGYMTTYATIDLALPLASAGILLATGQVAGLSGRLSMGFVAEFVGSTRVVLMALGLLMSVAGVAVGAMGPRWPWAAMLLATMVLGLSASGWNGLFYAEAARLAPEGRAAEATGGAQFIAYSGLIVGPLLFGLIAKAAGGFGAAYVSLAVLTLIGSLVLVSRSGRE